jgi:hypothetical protein
VPHAGAARAEGRRGASHGSAARRAAQHTRLRGCMRARTTAASSLTRHAAHTHPRRRRVGAGVAGGPRGTSPGGDVENAGHRGALRRVAAVSVLHSANAAPGAAGQRLWLGRHHGGAGREGAWPRGALCDAATGAACAQRASAASLALTMLGGFARYGCADAPRPRSLRVHASARCAFSRQPQVYGRRSDAGPPHAVGVCHFDASADDVARYLCAPANMAAWDSELCERSKVRVDAAARGRARTSACVPARMPVHTRNHPLTPHSFVRFRVSQLLRELNPDAALGYLEYYGEEAMGFSIVSPRVRCVRGHACAHTSLSEAPNRNAMRVATPTLVSRLAPAPRTWWC